MRQNYGTYLTMNKPIEFPYPPPSIRYYKVSGRQRIKGEWVVVRIGQRGLTTWDYFAPMIIGNINYTTKEKQ